MDVLPMEEGAEFYEALPHSRRPGFRLYPGEGRSG
jgi:hypothetical protein